jgi:signal peptidase I
MAKTTRARARSFLTLGVAMTGLFVARASLADHYHVPSGSMEPTVQVAEHVVVLKAAYGLRVPLTETYLLGPRTPARSDVVVLTSPESDTVLLKRVVAVGGDVVEVRDGRVRLTRGGRSVAEEDDARSLQAGPGPSLAPTLVPDGKVLVLGDNRGNSHDGRSFGWVSERALLGRAVAVVGAGGARGL